LLVGPLLCILSFSIRKEWAPEHPLPQLLSRALSKDMPIVAVYEVDDKSGDGTFESPFV